MKFALGNRPRAEEQQPAMPMPDPFAAIPRIAPGVEAREDSRGWVQLRKAIPPKPGLAAYVARRCGFHRQIRVNLDELGTLYWKHIDGRRTLRRIQEHIGAAVSVERAESERATLVFTKMLMLRYLIELELPADD